MTTGLSRPGLIDDVAHVDARLAPTVLVLTGAGILLDAFSSAATEIPHA